MFVGGGITFADRRHAGEQLGAAVLEQLRAEGTESEPLVVMGLVRGGLPVAEPVANVLNAPLDAFVSRKIGAPLQPEFGIGAIAEGGQAIINEHAARAVGASPAQLNAIIAQESAELTRRIQVYRGGQEHLPVAGKTVVLVDDGLATGVTARAALQALRAKGAGRIILAVPVGSASTVAELSRAEGLADDVVCLSQPRHFRAVGQWYDDFNQTTDAEVVAILKRFEARNAAARAAATAPVKGPGGSAPAPAGPADTAHSQDQYTSGAVLSGQEEEAVAVAAAAPEPAAAATTEAAAAPAPAPAAAAAAAAAVTMAPAHDEEVVITDASKPGIQLHGTLTVPEGARGLVIFAHGSGSSRHSPRNRQVAATLNAAGFGTLLFDLLSVSEAEQRANVFNIPLMADRLQLAVEWMEVTGKLPAQFPVGFFGASTGGGAALWAAAYLDTRVSAVVVRGGRPDLAAEKLPAVTAPTLLLVGGEDSQVLELNEAALQLLGAADRSALVVVPNAGHLFEGEGQLEEVAQQAAEWFTQHMVLQA